MNSVSKVVYNIISKNMSTAYLFSGGSIMHLINHFHSKNNINKMKFFIPSSEMSAGFCSLGHNKSLNKCDSVIITTSGPGLTNILTPLTDAYCDNIPLLVISGDVSSDMVGKHAFQEAPSIQLTKPITYWNCTIDNANDTNLIMNHAIELVKSGKQVHINIPKDIFTKSIHSNNKNLNYTIKTKYNFCKTSLDNCSTMSENQFNTKKESIELIANIINNCDKPILYVGRGAIDASNLITELAIKANIPVTTTLHGLGIFDEEHELSLKMIGMHGSEIANHAIQLASTIICIGARFDDRTTGNLKKYAPNANHIIHINSNVNDFNKVIDNSINIHGKSKIILKELLPLINFNNRIWINDLKKSFNINFPFNDSGLKQQHILSIFNNELLKRSEIKKKTIITTGVGNHQMFTAQLITHKFPNKIITSGSLGTMGSSCSFAIGSKIANPSAYVFSIDGDQSFNMLNDLKMIMNYNIGIKIIIMNDSKQSMVNVWEKLFFDNNIVATETVNPNYYLLSKAYNIKCININNKMKIEKITSLITEFIDYDNYKPIILNCIVDSDLCLPLVPPGNALDDMITFNNINKYKINKSSAPS